MKSILLLTSLIVILFFTGCTSKPSVSANLSVSELTDLQKNICTQDSDCWSTNGGCFTREWFTIEDAKAKKLGIDNQRPTSTPEISCVCEQNKCTQNIK